MNNLPTNEELIAVLDRIYQDGKTCILDDTGKKIDKTDFRPHIEPDSSGVFPHDAFRYSVSVADEAIEKEMPFFVEFFKEFIDIDTGKIGVSSLLINDKDQISINDFVQNHVMNAVGFLNSEKVSEILMDWKSRNEIEYRIGFNLKGVKVNKMIEIKEKGITMPSSIADDGKNNTVFYFLMNRTKVFDFRKIMNNLYLI